jgi:hypothetical protein
LSLDPALQPVVGWQYGLSIMRAIAPVVEVNTAKPAQTVCTGKYHVEGADDS